MTRVNVTSSVTPDKYYDEYRMVVDGRTLYSLQYVHDGDELYFRAATFDVFGDYSTADVYTNQSGKCELIADAPFYETYVGYFDYTINPEPVKCPDESEECIKYCNDVKCLILDDFNYIVQDINLQTQEKLSYNYTYGSKATVFDVVSATCPESNFTVYNYCDNWEWASFKPDCLYHANVTSNTSSTKYYEEYRMSYFNRPIYSLKYVHVDENLYYDLVYFSPTSYPTTWEVLTNMSGDCKIREDVSVADLYEFYDSSFDYYGDSVTVDCPDGTKNCTKYCSVIRCLVLDSNSRLVQDIKFDTQEELTYTYLEDLPTVDMFSMECEGVKYTAVDVCTKKAATINWDCAFHINVTNNVTSDYYDEYRMMSKKKAAYAHTYYHTEDKYYYDLAIFSLNENISIITLLTNWTGKCEKSYASGSNEIYDSEFVYFYDPKSVDCPDGSTGCTQYCSLIKCVIVDSNNRLLKRINTQKSTAYFYTYLDDVPSVDMFSMKCSGTQYNATDYCTPKSSSSSSSSSSASSSSSVSSSSSISSSSSVPPSSSSSRPVSSSSHIASSSSQPVPSSSHTASSSNQDSGASIIKAAFTLVIAVLFTVLL